MINDPSDEQAAEKVFDYFLHELISGQPPPDLAQRITAAWKHEQAQSPGVASRAVCDLVGGGHQVSQPVIARPVRAPASAPYANAPIQPSTQAQPSTQSQFSMEAEQPAAAHSVVARPIHSSAPALGGLDHDGLARCAAHSRPVSQGISLQRKVVAALLATGACGLLTILSWQLIDPDRGMTQHLLELARAEVRNLAKPPVAPLLPMPQPGSSSPATAEVAGPAAGDRTLNDAVSSEPAVGDTARPAVGSQTLAANTPDSPTDSGKSIPQFPLDRRSPIGPLLAGDVPGASLQPQPGPSATAASLERQQIVAQIDQRLAAVWQELSVEPSPKLDETQRAQRVSMVLTGQPAADSVSDLEAMISEATGSLPFARQWADQFVDTWLAGANLPADDSRVKTLKQHFADYIYEGRPWNATALELLGGDLTTAPQVASDTAASATAAGDLADRNSGEEMKQSPSVAAARTTSAGTNPIASAFVSALAGDGNHRLVSHIGSNFLNLDLACARCHDASSTNLAAQWSDTAANAEQAVGRQAMYWSLTAMLQGIEARAEEGGKRVVVDRQLELLAAGKPLTAYYDLIDGRLQVAEPRLPDGQAWETVDGAEVPRQALAQWLSHSPAMDQATVNQVWHMIFGQPLVSRTSFGFDIPTAGSQTDGIETVAQSPMHSAEVQQRELLELLSTQYRAHGYDLKQLVGWIVRSDAFRRQATQHTRAQWLAASQEQLQQWQIARASFASGARPTTAVTTQALETSLVTILQWRESSSTSGETALAQPVPSLAPVSPDKGPPASDSKGDNAEITLKDRVRFSPPAADELAFVDRLLGSQRLDWAGRVEHIVSLTPELVPSKRIHFLAEELLRQHKGDSRAALLDLLWAVKQ